MAPGAGHGDPTLSVHTPESAMGRSNLSSELQKRFGDFLWKCRVALQRVELGWREAPAALRDVEDAVPSRGVLDELRVCGGDAQSTEGLLAGLRVWGHCCGDQRGSCTLGSELLCDRTAPLPHPCPGWAIWRGLKAQQHQAKARYTLTCGAVASSALQTSICKPKTRILLLLSSFPFL